MSHSATTSVRIDWLHVDPVRSTPFMRWALIDSSDSELCVVTVPDDATQDEFNAAMLELTQAAYRYLQRDDS